MTATQTAKWTPGPWHVGSSAPAEVRSKSFTIASCGNPDSSFAKANAEFIARAANCHYDLLEACKAALALLDGFNGTFAESQQLADAIAKATS